MADDLPAPSEGKFLFYDTEDGKTRVQVLLEGRTCWMPQGHIAALFETTPQNITQHIRNIFSDGELSESATCKNYLQVQKEGNREVNRNLKIYNLEMLIAIGYRVRSTRGTQFRKWATQTLNEFLVKGFVLDDQRLKAAETTFGEDYFDELLERIRDIRASERRFYQKITDIYATAADYSADAEITRTFFATVQNKLEWAITGMTAAELIRSRADANEPHMGLKTWKNSPGGKIRKADVTIAKNYLSQEELSNLNRIVTMYLDYAEDQAKRGNVMTMAQWVGKLDGFLEFNGRDVLQNAGKVEKKVADALAIEQFEQYKAQQCRIEASHPVSDFDRFVDDVKRLDSPNPEETNE
ncbi:MAG: virulence RhuM family protein [Planctomycetales bacterium]|nr:virulence RhuM family protein [Planctomycetales bacterium]